MKRTVLAFLTVVVLMAAARLAHAQGSGSSNGIAPRVAALEAKIAALESSPSAPPMWSGATSRTCDGYWYYSCRYTLDREEFNTAGGYLSVPLSDSYGRVTALKAGYYRVVFSNTGGSGSTSAYLLRNDVVVDQALWSTWGQTLSSTAARLERILRLEVGDVLTINYSSGGPSPDANYSNSRLQIEYLGQ